MHIVDWYPTLVKLVGGNLSDHQPHPVDGLDVWPMIAAGAKSPHDAILIVQSPQRAALRMGDWKLLSLNAPETAIDQTEGTNPQGKGKNKKGGKKNAEGPRVELYNLATDIGEKQIWHRVNQNVCRRCEPNWKTCYAERSVKGISVSNRLTRLIDASHSSPARQHSFPVSAWESVVGDEEEVSVYFPS